jgi:uncharacterized protein (TIGR03435 family)
MTFTTFWNQGLLGLTVNHLWQSTLGVLVAWLLTQALKQNQARTRYWVWMVASVKLLVPFSVFVGLGEWLRPVATVPIESPQLAAAMVKMSQPFAQNIEPAIGFSGAAAGGGPVPHHGHPWAAILLAAWLCGFLLLLARWARTWWAIRATLRSASPVSLSMDVPVFSSSRLLEPGVFGIFRPVLLLPEKLMHRLSAPQLRSILAHEMCHIRRRDNLTAAIHMVIEAIFWFHPAVWWIETRLIEERERACDEAVLQLGNDAEVYAEGILNVCKFYTESPMVCISGVTGSDLKRRILRIMTEQGARKLDLGRKLLLSAVALLAVSVPVVFGVLHLGEVRVRAAASQGLAGTWQGLLHPGADQRIVLKISSPEGGAYKAVFYNIELGAGEGLPVTTITLEGATLKFSVAPISGAYQGKVGPDGTSITGTWSEGGAPQGQPLLLTRATPETEWTIPQPPPRIRMDANAHPTFEVATIKPSKPDEQRFMLVFRGNTFETIGTSLSQLITMAYEVHAKQIVGAPAWFDTEKFDITAKPDIKGTPNTQQLEAMVQKLIVDRFNLTFHHDQRELPVYVLSVAKTGSKLTNNGDPNGLPGFGLRAPGALNVHSATMSDFASMMQQTVLDRPVLDKTGLTGRFDFNLDWTPDDSQFGGRGASIPPPTDASNAPANLYTALEEQIGLKLEAAKAPAEVIVIDHSEKPSQN